MFCPYCGKEVANNTNYCSYCGAPLMHETESINQKTTDLVQPKKRKNLVFVIIIPVIAAVCIIAGIILFNNNKPDYQTFQSEEAMKEAFCGTWESVTSNVQLTISDDKIHEVLDGFYVQNEYYTGYDSRYDIINWNYKYGELGYSLFKTKSSIYTSYYVIDHDGRLHENDGDTVYYKTNDNVEEIYYDDVGYSDSDERRSGGGITQDEAEAAAKERYEKEKSSKLSEAAGCSSIDLAEVGSVITEHIEDTYIVSLKGTFWGKDSYGETIGKYKFIWSFGVDDITGSVLSSDAITVTKT